MKDKMDKKSLISIITTVSSGILSLFALGLAIYAGITFMQAMGWIPEIHFGGSNDPNDVIAGWEGLGSLAISGLALLAAYMILAFGIMFLICAIAYLVVTIIGVVMLRIYRRKDAPASIMADSIIKAICFLPAGVGFYELVDANRPISFLWYIVVGLIVVLIWLSIWNACMAGSDMRKLKLAKKEQQKDDGFGEG